MNKKKSFVRRLTKVAKLLQKIQYANKEKKLSQVHCLQLDFQRIPLIPFQLKYFASFFLEIL